LVAVSTHLRLDVLGGFSMKIGDEALHLPGNAQRLIAFVALQLRPVSRARIAFTLWPDRTEAHAFGSLRSALFELRRPGHDLLRVSDTHAELDPALAVDAHDLLSLVDSIRSDASAWVESAPGRELLEAELLPDWYDDWVLVARERFLELRVESLETLCRAQIEAGMPAEAIATGLSALRADSSRESTTRLLIEAQLALGNRAQALAHYRRLELSLCELGLLPSAATIALLPSIVTSLTLG
jgi:DNA-binding SARP family transcriptional activator